GHHPGAYSAEAPHRPPHVAFVFCGQGAHWYGMGKGLLKEEPVFRNTIERCDAVIRPITGWSVVDELRRGEEDGRLELTSVAQPVLFAIQAALDALWRSWGIEPVAVVGHSVGELAAAYSSGALSLEVAARIVAHRGICLEEHALPGKMIAVALGESDAWQLIDGLSGQVSVAASNSPQLVTLAGDASAVTRLGAKLDASEVWWKPLPVQFAFHTALLEPACAPFLKAIGEVANQGCTVPFISTVTGKAADADALTAAYWWDNMRQPVRFADAIQDLLGRGVQVFLEIGPHPVLGSSIRQCRLPASPSIAILPSLMRHESERRATRSSFAGLCAHGVEGTPAALWPEGGRFIALPPHPWRKQKYWHECPEVRNARLAPDYHPLLGRRALGVAGTWEAAMDTSDLEWLRDHAVGGQILFPAAGFVEMALAAATRSLGAETCTLDELVIRRGLFLSSEATSLVQTTADPATFSIAFASRTSDSEETWSPHVEATFRALSRNAAPTRLDTLARQQEASDCVSAADCYRAFSEMGLDYGPAFQSIVEIHRGTGWALGCIEATEKDAGSHAWHVHPTVLDACFQVLLETIPRHTLPDRYVALPDRIDRVDFHRSPGSRAWCEARIRDISPARIVGDIRVFNDDGEPAIDITGFQCQAVPRARRREEIPIEKCFFRTQWRHQPLPKASVPSVPIRGIDLGELVRASNSAALEVGHDATREWIENSFANSNRLTLAYIARGLRDLGFHLRAGETIDLDALVRSGKVLDHFRLHFARCVRWLVGMPDAGTPGRERWTLSHTVEDEDLDALWVKALVSQPDGYRHYRLIELCGRRLPEVWSGALDPLELLFSPECMELLEHSYQDSLPSRYTNTFVQQIISRLVSALPENRPIRILEVGAGTAATAVHVAPVLPRRRSEYWFTDLSPFFMARAEEKLRRYEFMRYRPFNLEHPLAEQDIPPKTFDVVIAAHVLHATRGVHDAMRRCREALVDGGLLLAMETCIPPPFLDMVFGMTEGWWYFREDAARPDGPHLSRQGWLSVFEKEGFEEACASGDDQDHHTVFVGRNPDSDSPPVFPSAPVEGVPPERNWVVFADQGGCAQAIVTKLRERALRCIEVRAGKLCEPTCADEFYMDPEDEHAPARLQQLCHAEFDGDYSLLHLWSLDIPDADVPSEEDVDAAETLACHCTVNLLQAFGGAGEHLPRRIMLVTRGAQVLPSETNPAAFLQAPLIGLARVAAGEFAALKFRMIDIDPAADLSTETLWMEMVADDNEEEVAWRGTNRFIPRLEAAPPGVPEDPIPCAGDPVPFKLAVQQLGNLNSLELRETKPVPPGPDEIQIEVHWAALNFRDVLRALSRYSSEVVEQVELGSESSGIVRAVGKSVTNFQVGDRVVFCCRGGISSVITVRADWAAKVPENLRMLAAVSMPVAFMTADFALRGVGHLRRDERVLIHSAAGGVGLAAVQIARCAGSRIYATAGSRPKRELLAKFGVDRIMDSRSLDFSDEIQQETNGKGIDVVLNSLAGQAMLRSLACVAPFGRFLELGKRDFLDNTKVGLWPFQNNVSYHAIDIAPLLDGPPNPRLVSLDEIMERAHTGLWSPLPVQVFPAARVIDAFRYMAQGAHVGKVVIDTTQHWGHVRRAQRDIRLRPNATYLVTGAFGGVGLVVARWLVDSGAKHLMLVSRKGPQTDASTDLINELRERGVDVRVRQCDVGDFAQLAGIFTEVQEQMPALAGVFHLAMVLDDGAIMNMSRSRFHQVMIPKFRAACNLHRLCKDIPLDLFVLFSSGTASIGTPGQSNYSAANAGLEALAAFRRAHGLPGTAIAWGMLGEVGYAADRPEILQHLMQIGYREIGPADFCKALELALGINEPVQGVARVDWRIEVQKLRARGNRQSLLSALADVEDTGTTMTLGIGRDTILAAAPEQRAQLISDLLRELTARILGTGTTKIDSDKPLTDLGFDSLMAIELAGQVESQLGVAFPMRSLGGDVTLARLTELLTRALTGSNTAGPKGATPAAEPIDWL
ncbi:MAG: SDR family NAD(P)-dependent oxidoreductase, partial [Candidatus Hydrogenedentales bacterium]